MKECTKCKKTKPLTDFPPDKRRSDRRGSHCRQCDNARRKPLPQFLSSLKEKPCHDCGKQYPAVLMDFDHVPERGEKVGIISRLPKGKALEEIAKCDVVCPMCHRIRTATRAGLLTEEELNVLSKL